MTEAGLEIYLKREAALLDIECYKFVSPARRGVPDDILVAYPSLVFFVELKSPKGTGKTSKLQIRELRRLHALGCKTYIIDSTDAVDTVLLHLSRLSADARKRENKG